MDGTSHQSPHQDWEDTRTTPATGTGPHQQDWGRSTRTVNWVSELGIWKWEWYLVLLRCHDEHAEERTVVGLVVLSISFVKDTHLGGVCVKLELCESLLNDLKALLSAGKKLRSCAGLFVAPCYLVCFNSNILQQCNKGLNKGHSLHSYQTIIYDMQYHT